jgi:hypothetical protein
VKLVDLANADANNRRGRARISSDWLTVNKPAQAGETDDRGHPQTTLILLRIRGLQAERKSCGWGSGPGMAPEL